MIRLSSLFVLLYLALGLSAQGKVVYVRKNPPGSTRDGTSWTTAFSSVQAALTASSSSDEVWVASGLYTEYVAPGSGVALYGGFAGTEIERNQRDVGAHPTVLVGDGADYRPTVDCQVGDILVDGFTIRNTADGKPAVLIRSFGSATLANNTISTSRGAGVLINPGTATLVHNILSGNGDGVYLQEGSATLTGNIVENNNRGVYVDDATLSLADNTISGNGYGVFLDYNSQVTLSNNTISASARDGVFLSGYASTAALVNNIIAFNAGNGISQWMPTTIVQFSHNDLYGNLRGDSYQSDPPLGEGNISVDPQLANLYHDVHLQPGSPCRDAGDDSAASPDDIDIDSQPRIQGAHADIGSDESDGTTWLVPSLIWYVSPTGADTNDGRTWATAKRSIQSGLAIARGTDEVWVAKGTYNENIIPKPGTALYGGFSGTESQRSQRDIRANPTILDPGSGNAITCGVHGLTVDGFHIRNSYRGVNISAGTVTIAHNTISNSDYHGIIVFAPGTAIITNNRISGSAHGEGGVTVLTDGSATISDNVISGNTNDGVHIEEGTAVVSNNTIAGNHGNGVYLLRSKVKITNNSIAFNGNAGVYNIPDSDISAFSHNDVYGNTAGPYYQYTPPSDQGNISLDPLFGDLAAGDFHLKSTSPCIDAGDDSTVTPGETDVEGRPRILGAHVEIGAYEYSTTPIPFTLADVIWCLSVAGGLASASSDDLARLNVEAGNTALDLFDAIRLARKVAGLDANP